MAEREERNLALFEDSNKALNKYKNDFWSNMKFKQLDIIAHACDNKIKENQQTQLRLLKLLEAEKKEHSNNLSETLIKVESLIPDLKNKLVSKLN